MAQLPWRRSVAQQRVRTVAAAGALRRSGHRRAARNVGCTALRRRGHACAMSHETLDCHASCGGSGIIVVRLVPATPQKRWSDGMAMPNGI